MIQWSSQNIFLHTRFIDFRKSLNGLIPIVVNEIEQEIFNEACFIFCNKSRDKIKILYWDKTGFCLWYKRLEADTFKWPKTKKTPFINITQEEFDWLLRGLDFSKILPHKPIKSMSFY
jgi:transposase